MSGIAVLGCGPAGLIAAQAAATRFKPIAVEIFSRHEKSEIRGAQYLHGPIPRITPDEPEYTVWYTFRGTRDGYAQKVYGRSDSPASWDLFTEGPAAGWDVRSAYDKMWSYWHDNIYPINVIGADQLDAIIHDRYDLVICSIPKKAVCKNPSHRFNFTTTYISRPSWNGSDSVDRITYNGDPSEPWHRESRINGWYSREFPQSAPGRIPVIKPQSNDCDCWPGVTFVGRYGKWERDVLLHSVYEEVMSALQLL